MRELERVREIFLTEVDEETRNDNLEKIKEWEDGLMHAEAFASWQDQDITKELLKEAKETYRDIGIILANNRELTEKERYSFWGRQDACLFLLSLMAKDAKGTLEQIQKEIKIAFNATN